MSHQEVQIAYGSTIGRDHRAVPKNCQDDLRVVRTEQCTIGIVADGCGSGAHSEVGAQIGVRVLAECLEAEVRDRSGSDIRWPRVQQHVLATLDVLARQMGGNYRQVVEEYFLFTIVGVLLTDKDATFFALGDGVIIVNGYELTLGPFEGNKPPYLGYGLLLPDVDIEPDLVQFRTVCWLPLKAVQHFLIGSDGVQDLIDAETKCLPGLAEPVGSIAGFWERDRYFGANHELLNRQLKLISRDWPKRDPQPGLLPDDTSMIVGRKAPPPDPQTTEE
ncbi:MAG: hypothetical protein JWN38_767 [Candidatus Saccharibacteria bacterium]|nr:hypothetical protein [Candidatus Saccharibacteria bacterium]